MKERILGSFGKGVDGSVSVNFARSRGVNCDRACHIWDDCYAAGVEAFRRNLALKLERIEQIPPALVCGQAIVEMQKLVDSGIVIPWLRISVAGSVPQPETVRKDKLFRKQFRAMMLFARNQSIPVHFPGETWDKVRFYRALVGDLVTVRESCKPTRFVRAVGAVSACSGGNGLSQDKRRELARQLAKRRREYTGRKCVVCPAVTAAWAAYRDSRPIPVGAHCGNCVACADPAVDVVYPLHSSNGR